MTQNNSKYTESIGDTHFEIVSYDGDMVEVISAPYNMEDAYEMAKHHCGWSKENIRVIHKVQIVESFFPNKE